MNKLYLVLASLPEVPEAWRGQQALSFVADEEAEGAPTLAVLCVARDAEQAVSMASEYCEQDHGLVPTHAAVRDISPYADELIERELEGSGEEGTLLDIGLLLVVGDDEESQSEATQFVFDTLMEEDQAFETEEVDDEDEPDGRE